MEQIPLLKEKAINKDNQELPTEQEKSSPKAKDLAVILSGGSHAQVDGPLGRVSDLARSILSSGNKKKQGDISMIIREPTHTPTEAESSISALIRHTIEEVDEDGYLIVQHPEAMEMRKNIGIEMNIKQDFYHLITKVDKLIN